MGPLDSIVVVVVIIVVVGAVLVIVGRISILSVVAAVVGSGRQSRIQLLGDFTTIATRSMYLEGVRL